MLYPSSECNCYVLRKENLNEVYMLYNYYIGPPSNPYFLIVKQIPYCVIIIFLNICTFQGLFSSVPSAGDVEESKTTEHSPELGD